MSGQGMPGQSMAGQQIPGQSLPGINNGMTQSGFNQTGMGQTPSLPSFNSIMNPTSFQQQMPMTNQQQFLQDQLLQQQMANSGFGNQQLMAAMTGNAQQPGALPSMLGGQGQQQDILAQFNQQQQFGQKTGLMGSQGMPNIPGLQGLGQLGQFSNGMIDQGTGLHLPSFGQIQQNLLQSPYLNPTGQIGQLGLGQFSDMNQFQALQQQEKNYQLMNQAMGLSQQQQNMLGAGGMDPSHPLLPSMNQIPGFGQLQQPGAFQLPSLSKLGQGFQNQMSGFDPYGNSLFGLMQGGGGSSYMNPMLGGPQGLLSGMNQTMSSGALGSMSGFDEMSMVLNGMQTPMLTPQGFNPFGQQFGSLGDLAFGSGMQAQLPSLSQQHMLMSQGSSGQLPFPGGFPGMPNKPLGHLHQQFQQLPSFKSTNHHPTIIDPNLIQPDNLEAYNDKLQDPPVPPCIMDPGRYDLSWLLEPREDESSLLTCPYITQEEIDAAIQLKHFVDQLYLVKWKSLSYQQATWEPESLIKPIFEEKMNDYVKYNRSLDQQQRERLDQLIKNHKKMLRFTEKKYQNQGKRMDANQENYLALQEAKINRQLLNQKLQEIMGESFYQLIHYNYKAGLVPQFKKPHQKLKDYQVIGLNWLIRAWHENRNVVLADEMGLGKTIMTLSLFDHLNKFCKLRGPYLILAPLTTLEHWKRIADEWTTLNSILYYDPSSVEGRGEIRHWEWFYTDVTYKGTITQKSELFKFNLIITSFEVFMQDLNPILQEIPFTYIVVDEAHRLKNKQAKTLKLLKDHPCKRILLLTGTPVQNNTKELWTLLNYIEPEKFDSLEVFLEQYGNLESFEQIQKLHTILKPHFLRRLKEEVDNSIPPLQETVIEVGLTTLQNTYYKGIYGENRMVLAKFGTNSIKTSQLNNMDIQLRKCCNHLFLLKGVEEELTRECRTEEDIYEKLLESSGKLMLLDKFIEKFKQENHKMLIFSQFKRMLDVIELYLRMKRVQYEKLTGSVKTADRISAIQRFNDDKTFGVFLLTTRAGGLGINLTSARVVIIFDSDWNPQNDLQAIARAHRIGQMFEVQVYRLITSKTYEEQMFERASKKLGMEQALFSKGAFHQNDDIELNALHLRGITELKQDSKEIENLLKYGAYAFVDQDGEDDQVNFNKDIDEILATGKKKEFTYSKGIYTLQKSTFNASKYEKLPDVNDPDFWNKVMPFDSIISITVLEKRFKKEKKEMGKNEKVQKEFFKDFEIVFNDFMDAKFDIKMSAASRKTLESDEEKLREILKKMIKLNGMKAPYVEKCKEWLKDMLRTNKRKKPEQKLHMPDAIDDGEGLIEEEEFGDLGEVQDDDIILYDSDENPLQNRNLRKRQIVPQAPKQTDDQLQSNLPKKRGRKPKNPQNKPDSSKQDQLQSQEGDGDDNDFYDDAEGDEYDDEDEQSEYGDEEEKGNYEHKPSGNGLSQRGRFQNESDDQDDDDEEPESRYGLRGRRKRFKTGKEEFNFSAAQVSQSGMTQQQLKQFQKMREMLSKRNEKNGIVCSYCQHPETLQKPCKYFCGSYCQRYFHEQCKEQLFPKQQCPNSTNKIVWQCEDCVSNVAHCFCCKEKGTILLFPKKGKPKAAGMLDQPITSNLEEAGDLDVEIDEDENQEDFDEDIDEGVMNEDQDLEESKQGESPTDQAITSGDQQQPIRDLLQELPQLDSPQVRIELSESNGNPEIDQTSPSHQPIAQKEQSSKIVINLLQSQAPNTNQSKNESPNESQLPADLQLSNERLGEIDEPNASDGKYVVRCTLGGCFKYYHVKCVYKNKNVSCINSMKVQRFRCPLHYCEFCLASGDSVLIVQCVLCPIAYHLKCLPLDSKAIRLTKKYIVCGRHGKQSEDFPKYEEKNQTSYLKRDIQSEIQGRSSEKGMMDKNSAKKRKPKKRGRKPRRTSGAVNGSGNIDESSEASPHMNSLNAQQMRPMQQYSQQQYSQSKQNHNSGNGAAGSQGGFMIKLGGQNISGTQNLSGYGHAAIGNYEQRPKLQHQQSSSVSQSIKIENSGTPRPLFSVEKKARK